MSAPIRNPSPEASRLQRFHPQSNADVDIPERSAARQKTTAASSRALNRSNGSSGEKKKLTGALEPINAYKAYEEKVAHMRELDRLRSQRYRDRQLAKKIVEGKKPHAPLKERVKGLRAEERFMSGFDKTRTDYIAEQLKNSSEKTLSSPIRSPSLTQPFLAQDQGTRKRARQETPEILSPPSITTPPTSPQRNQDFKKYKLAPAPRQHFLKVMQKEKEILQNGSDLAKKQLVYAQERLNDHKTYEEKI